MQARTQRFITTLIAVFVCSTAFAATSGWRVSGGRAIAFSPDAQLILTGMQLRTTASGSLVRTFNTGYSSATSVNAGAFSPDGKLVALGFQAFNQNLFLFNASDGTRIGGRITAHNNGTTCLAFSPTEPLLASGGADGTVKLWHVPDMTLVRTVNGGVGYRPRVFAVIFSRDGSSIVLGGQGGILQFRVSDGQLLRQLTTVDTLTLALSQGGNYLASGSNEIDQYGQCVDCTTKFWQMSNGAFLGQLEGNNNGVKSVSWSPDLKYLAVGGGDRVYNGAIRFFSMPSGQLLDTWYQEPDNPSSYVSTVAFAPFGRMFAYARADGIVTMTFY